MKFNTLLFTLTFCLSSFTFQADAQVQTPQLSPECDFRQTVGLTDVSISYSRPSMRGRVIFGNVVPYNEVWRLGANKNTTIEVSQEIYFNSDTLSFNSTIKASLSRIVFSYSAIKFSCSANST